MVQKINEKFNALKVLEVFFKQPTTIHFIKEISKKINLSHPSVRNYINYFFKQRLIKKKKSKPFDGYIADRENQDFIFYKRVYNLYSLKDLKDFLVRENYPRLITVFGSYSLGEDTKDSDIDIVLVSGNKIRKQEQIKEFENKLDRKIHLIFVKDFNELDKNIRKKIKKGIVLYGSFE